MKLIFISGKYRGDTEHNIIMARRAAIKLWQSGWAVFCPHMNTANLDEYAPDSVWLAGGLEILKHCDAIFMLKDWQVSEGARAEYELAISLGKEVIYEDG